MGLLDSLVGSAGPEPTTTDSQDRKYAILLNAGPEDTPTAGNALNYAIELDDAGYEVGVSLDGKATKWPGEFAENPDRPFSHDWGKVRDRGLLIGACGYCANAFEAAQACSREESSLRSGSGEHAPSVAELAEQGYELITV